MPSHWPWQTDPAIVEKLDQLTSLLTKYHNQEMKAMSKIDDAIGEVEVSAEDMKARVLADVETLTAKIAELEGIIAAGGDTPERLARLAALKATLDGLDPHKPDTLPV
jgi:peptidase E